MSNIIRPVICCGILLSAGISSVQAQTASDVIVAPGSAVSKGAGSKAALELVALAKLDAAKFAWTKLRAQQRFSTDAMRFTNEQNALMAKAITEKCNFTKLDQVLDRSTKVVTIRFNIDCPSQDLASSIAELKVKSEAERSSGLDAVTHDQLVYLFLSRRLTSMQASSNFGGVYQASGRAFELVSAQSLADGLVGRMSSVGLNAISYADLIGAGCASVDIADVNREFSVTPPGQSDYGLTAETRAQIITAVRRCGVRYLALGAADVGVTGLDPQTGYPIGRVTVSAQVLDIRQMLPITIARVRTVTDDTGADENTAEENAMAKAAGEVGVKLVEQVKVKGVR